MTFIPSLNQFAHDTLQKMNLTDAENTVFSPFSAFVCVAMSLSLFKDETRNEILESLRIPINSGEDIASFYSILKQFLRNEISRYVSTSNRVWVNQQLPFQDETFSVNKNILEVPIEKVGFPEPGCTKINEEVKRATHGMINEIVNQDDVSSDTAIALVNAIYFKSDWEKKFDVVPGECQFTLVNGSTVDVTMILSKGRTLPYYRNEQFEVISIPYQGDQYEFVIILPIDAKNGYEQLLSLSFEEQERLLSEMKKTKLSLRMPKFKIETKTQLTPIFAELGMKRAMTGSAQCTDPNVSYFVSKIIQDAKIEVDENGTVAAAATAMIMKKMALRPAVFFNADHPFLYLLRNANTKAVLFEGYLTDPR